MYMWDRLYMDSFDPNSTPYATTTNTGDPMAVLLTYWLTLPSNASRRLLGTNWGWSSVIGRAHSPAVHETPTLQGQDISEQGHYIKTHKDLHSTQPSHFPVTLFQGKCTWWGSLPGIRTSSYCQLTRGGQLMNQGGYSAKMQAMMLDRDTYQPLSKDPTSLLEIEINRVLLKLRQKVQLSDRNYNQLCSSAGRVPRLYSLA